MIFEYIANNMDNELIDYWLLSRVSERLAIESVNRSQDIYQLKSESTIEMFKYMYLEVECIIGIY